METLTLELSRDEVSMILRALVDRVRALDDKGGASRADALDALALTALAIKIQTRAGAFDS